VTEFSKQENMMTGHHTDITMIKKMLASLENKEKRPRILTEKKSFLKLDNYDGKIETFEDWKFHAECFFGEEGKHWRDLLDAVDKLPTGSDEELNEVWQRFAGMGHDMEYINTQMYNVLSMNLRGKALGSIKNLRTKTESHGLAAWWKIGRESNMMTGNKMQGLVGKVYGPKRAKTYAEVFSKIDEWDGYVKLFEESKEGQKLCDATKIFSLRQLVPEALEMDIVRNGNLDTYLKVRNYITEQVNIRKDLKNSSQGPIPMELDLAAKKVLNAMIDGGESPAADESKEKNGDDGEEEEPVCPPCGESSGTDALSQIFSMMKGRFGGKGGDDGGKGNQKFKGNCSGCGKYGHRVRDCWHADGKGKGQGQKGDPKGKGRDQGKSNWNNNNNNWQWPWAVKGNQWNWNKPKGKGKGAYALEWGDDGSKPSWTLSLSSASIGTAKEENLLTPPGLGSRFEVLRLADVQNEEIDFEAEFPMMTKEKSSSARKMPPMKNYSKGMIRKTKDPVRTWKKTDKKQVNMFVKAPGPKELCPFVGAKPDDEGWVKVTGVMDSGASESVAPPTMCPHIEVKPSVGSQSGQHYVSASEDTIPNLGEQNLEIVTGEGRDGCVTYQVAEVTRPLNAVSEICDAGGEEGQYVIFSKHGGVIVNPETGSQTAFERQDGIYCLEFWVKPPGFTRQGW